MHLCPNRPPAGQLVISHSTVSRKHLTITVDEVADGNAYNIGARPGLTIEDLKTKIGTFVDGTNIKGSKYKLQDESAELTIGKFAGKFRYAWLFQYTYINT